MGIVEGNFGAPFIPPFISSKPDFTCVTAFLRTDAEGGMTDVFPSNVLPSDASPPVNFFGESI